MKNTILLLAVLFFQSNMYGQSQESSYPFEVKIEGKGDPIILIPGLASSGEVWNQTLEALQNHYQCHILTLAGFNTQEPINLEKGFLPVIQEGIKKYIQQELTQRPILIGHSLGGFLSMSLASEDSKMLKKIIIVDSYPFISAAFNPNATEESSIPQAKMIKKMILSTADSTFAEQQKVTMATMMKDSQKIKIATTWSLNSSRKTIAQAMYELMTTDLREKISQIKIPVLVLGSWYAAKDYGVTKEMIQSNYERQFQGVSSVKIKIAPTAKHFIMWDEPNWFYKEIKVFMNHE
ncbi:alpha/beta hydrolase [Mesonia sp. MT50]|uniref:Alpha/beta hydrolase n=1 Tax=Mesonia profundi TaxID=3070998 RepID=A0ABU1A3T5_9FLAO|nr:alpha/beta hydrolase [Mesonia profundi]MDQ7918380.1 alpha/beta hydrolase [Mesonia profundi]